MQVAGDDVGRGVAVVRVALDHRVAELAEPLGGALHRTALLVAEPRRRPARHRQRVRDPQRARRSRGGLGERRGGRMSLTASRNSAVSSTPRVTAPVTDMPCQFDPIGTRSRCGLSPNSPQHAAGMRIEPAPSVASAAAASPAATAVAEPPLDPPDVRAGIPRVEGRAERERLGRRERLQLRHVRLAEHHRAGVAQPAHDLRVLRRRTAVGERAVRRDLARDVGVVLDRDRDAVERRRVVAAAPVGRVGGGQRLVGEHHPVGPELRVEPRDPLQVELGQLARDTAPSRTSSAWRARPAKARSAASTARDPSGSVWPDGELERDRGGDAGAGLARLAAPGVQRRRAAAGGVGARRPAGARPRGVGRDALGPPAARGGARARVRAHGGRRPDRDRRAGRGARRRRRSARCRSRSTPRTRRAAAAAAAAPRDPGRARGTAGGRRREGRPAARRAHRRPARRARRGASPACPAGSGGSPAAPSPSSRPAPRASPAPTARCSARCSSRPTVVLLAAVAGALDQLASPLGDGARAGRGARRRARRARPARARPGARRRRGPVARRARRAPRAPAPRAARRAPHRAPARRRRARAEPPPQWRAAAQAAGLEAERSGPRGLPAALAPPEDAERLARGLAATL